MRLLSKGESIGTHTSYFHGTQKITLPTGVTSMASPMEYRKSRVVPSNFQDKRRRRESNPCNRFCRPAHYPLCHRALSSRGGNRTPNILVNGQALCLIELPANVKGRHFSRPSHTSIKF